MTTREGAPWGVGGSPGNLRSGDGIRENLRSGVWGWVWQGKGAAEGSAPRSGRATAIPRRAAAKFLKNTLANVISVHRKSCYMRVFSYFFAPAALLSITYFVPIDRTIGTPYRKETL